MTQNRLYEYVWCHAWSMFWDTSFLPTGLHQALHVHVQRDIHKIASDPIDKWMRSKEEVKKCCNKLPLKHSPQRQWAQTLARLQSAWTDDDSAASQAVGTLSQLWSHINLIPTTQQQASPVHMDIWFPFQRQQRRETQTETFGSPEAAALSRIRALILADGHHIHAQGCWRVLGVKWPRILRHVNQSGENIIILHIYRGKDTTLMFSCLPLLI